MIKTAIRCPNGMLMVFDEKGRQVLEYQRKYDEVKEKILKDAPPDTLFGYFLDYDSELRVVPKEEW
jgi:hypothetical protein